MVEKKKFSVKGFESANQKLRIAPLPNLLGWKQKCKFLQNRNLSNDQQTLFCQNIIYNLPNKSTSEKKDTGFVLLFWLWYQHLFCRRAKNLRRFRNLIDQLAEQKTFVDNVEAVADLRRLHFSKTCTWNLNVHILIDKISVLNAPFVFVLKFKKSKQNWETCSETRATIITRFSVFTLTSKNFRKKSRA